MIWLEMLTVEVCKKYVIHPHFPPTLISGSFIFYEFFNPFAPFPAAAAPGTTNSSPEMALLTPASPQPPGNHPRFNPHLAKFNRIILLAIAKLRQSSSTFALN